MSAMVKVSVDPIQHAWRVRLVAAWRARFGVDAMPEDLRTLWSGLYPGLRFPAEHLDADAGQSWASRCGDRIRPKREPAGTAVGGAR